jgi:hypothetical protein
MIKINELQQLNHETAKDIILVEYIIYGDEVVLSV